MQASDSTPQRTRRPIFEQSLHQLLALCIQSVYLVPPSYPQLGTKTEGIPEAGQAEQEQSLDPMQYAHGTICRLGR